MDKLNDLKLKLESFQARTAAKEEIKAFITLTLTLLKKSKEEFSNLSAENLKTIKDSIAYIEAFHTKQVNTLDGKINTATGQFDANMAELKALIAKVQTIKPIDGVDGVNPDPKDVVPLVLAK